MDYAIGYPGFLVRLFLTGSLQMVRGIMRSGEVAIPLPQQDRAPDWYVSADGTALERGE